MNRWIGYFLLVVLLPLAGGAAGRLAAPGLARNHYIVQVAERVRYEEANRLDERTLQSSAWRELGMPVESLYAQARGVESDFALGATLFGVFCGLVAALKVVQLLNERPPLAHDAYPPHCVACGRCFQYCPLERKRVRRSSAGRPSA